MDLNRRMMDIYRQKIAMGGCDMGGYESNDYEELLGRGGVYAGGVYAGGARTKGAVDKKPRKVSPRIKFQKAYMKQHGVTFKEAMVALKGKPTPAKYGKTLKEDGKKPKAKSGSKAAKLKTTKKVSKKEPSRYGYPKRLPSKTQLNNLGIDKATYFNLLNAIPLNTKREKERIGYVYANRDKLGRCISPDPEGDYWLNSNYDCRKLKKNVKKDKKKNVYPLEKITVSPMTDMIINKVNLQPTKQQLEHRLLQIEEQQKMLSEEKILTQGIIVSMI